MAPRVRPLDPRLTLRRKTRPTSDGTSAWTEERHRRRREQQRDLTSRPAAVKQCDRASLSEGLDPQQQASPYDCLNGAARCDLPEGSPRRTRVEAHAGTLVCSAACSLEQSPAPVVAEPAAQLQTLQRLVGESDIASRFSWLLSPTMQSQRDRCTRPAAPVAQHCASSRGWWQT